MVYIKLMSFNYAIMPFEVSLMDWEALFNLIGDDIGIEQINKQIDKEYLEYDVFPPRSKIYNAFELTPFDQVKVVILGQDPYHDINQAHGLAFSVKDGVKMPPSLRNMLKELEDDIGCSRLSTDLTDWAEQGILLLNNVLTVRAHEARSHHFIGWQRLTEVVVREISDHHEHVVFVLWGNDARKKKEMIHERHSIIESVHPSPLSAYRGFLGSKPYSQINNALIAHGQIPIEWCDNK